MGEFARIRPDLARVLLVCGCYSFCKADLFTIQIIFTGLFGSIHGPRETGEWLAPYWCPFPQGIALASVHLTHRANPTH